MTQIMALNNLTPEIRESILILTLVKDGKEPIHDKMLRPIVAEVDWARQRVM